MQHEYLTPEEIAEKLRIHPDTVRRWIRTGALKGVKVGPRQWRVTRESIEAFLNDNDQDKRIRDQVGE